MDDPNLLHPFDELVRPLNGMRVSRAWNGYGSAICLDLGELHEEPAGNRSSLCGEAAILIQWDWRAEFKAGVVVGSSSSRKSIKQFLERLEGRRINSVSLDDTGPSCAFSFPTASSFVPWSCTGRTRNDLFDCHLGKLSGSSTEF